MRRWRGFWRASTKKGSTMDSLSPGVAKTSLAYGAESMARISPSPQMPSLRIFSLSFSPSPPPPSMLRTRGKSQGLRRRRESTSYEHHNSHKAETKKMERKPSPSLPLLFLYPPTKEKGCDHPYTFDLYVSPFSSRNIKYYLFIYFFIHNIFLFGFWLHSLYLSVSVQSNFSFPNFCNSKY